MALLSTDQDSAPIPRLDLEVLASRHLTHISVSCETLMQCLPPGKKLLVLGGEVALRLDGEEPSG